MKHPDPKCQKSQEEFLRNCPPEDKEFHARLFRIGNAAYRYHQLANTPKNEDSLKLYYDEWLESLPPNISADMRAKGFEYCKAALSFSRYVNERTDIGLDEWMQRHLSDEDYNASKNPGRDKK